MSHYSGAGIRGLGSLLSLSWAEMCWTSAHVSSSPVSQGCACTGLHTLCGQLLQHQPVHRPMPSACKDSFDGFHSSLRFLYRHFSLLWKLLCLQPVVKGGSSSVFRLLPRAEDSQVSSTRSVCGALDTASSKLTNKLDTSFCCAYCISLLQCARDSESSTCLHREWPFLTLATPEQLRLAFATCVSILVTQGRNLNTTLSSL